MTTTTTLSAGLKSDFSSLSGAKFTGTSNHDSKWGLLANFDNGFSLLFLAGNPSAKWLFSDAHKGFTCDGTNKQGLPNLCPC